MDLQDRLREHAASLESDGVPASEIAILYEAAAEIDRQSEVTQLRSRVEEQSKRIAELEAKLADLSKAAFKAIDDEPEYPNLDDPDDIEARKNVLGAIKSGDDELIEEALRITVQLTKQGIKDRFRAAIDAARGEG